MKCIRNRWNGQVRRVEDAQATRMVRETGSQGEQIWRYCAKEEWKQGNPVPRKQTIQTEATA